MSEDFANAGAQRRPARPSGFMPPGIGTDTPVDLAAAHERLARLVLSARPLGASLSLIAEIARDHLPAVDEVSITLIQGDRPRSMAVHGARAARLDERQYEQGFGPCMHAAVSGTTIAVEDTHTDTSYPEYSALAAAVGVRHSISIALPLTLADHCAALNLYGGGEPLDPVSRDVADSFAGYAAVALTNAAVLAGALTQVEQMRSAMAARAAIEQAKGIIMARRNCTADEAFALLRGASNETNRKLRDIALDLVNPAGRRPETTQEPARGRHSAEMPEQQ